MIFKLKELMQRIDGTFNTAQALFTLTVFLNSAFDTAFGSAGIGIYSIRIQVDELPAVEGIADAIGYEDVGHLPQRIRWIHHIPCIHVCRVSIPLVLST